MKQDIVVFHKLALDASLREDAIYSEDAWQVLNPDGFIYTDSYHDIPMELYTDGYEAYFLKSPKAF